MEPDFKLIGTKVGEYDIIAKIGTGGMGVVYEGLQSVIGKRVAVKVLLPRYSSDEELVARFLAEARAVNAIRHRGIVDIFSFGQIGGTGAHYLVMEYLDGKPFDKIVEERGSVTLAEGLAWAEQILDALDAAHEVNIIHRDIKPSNLFLVNGAKGRQYVKLLDFGIAKLTTDGGLTPQTRASMVIGTPDYMAPEQAKAKAISFATDLYAVGCVLFELLSGRRPFVEESPIETMYAHVRQPVPRLRALMPDIPEPVDAIVFDLMQKEASQRPASAEVARQRVLQALAAAGVSSSPSQVGMPKVPSQRVAALATPMPPTRLSASVKAVEAEPSEATREPSVEATVIRTQPVPVVAEPTAVDQVPLKVSQPLPLASPPATSRRLGIWAGGALLAVAGAVGLVVATRAPSESAQVVASVPQVPAEGLSPVLPVEPAPAPVVPLAQVKPEPAAVEPKPVKPTKAPPEKRPGENKTPAEVADAAKRERLTARLRQLTSLATKRNDSVVLQFIDQAKTQVREAKTAQEFQEASVMLDEIARQLK